MPHGDATPSPRATGPALLAALLPTASLLLVTAIWGSTFFMLKDALDLVGAADFLAVRFAIAGAAACALCWRRLLRLTRRQALTGIGVGAVYGLAQIAQTVGLRYTPASTAGFVTALYVVITPMLALVLLRTRVSRVTWVAAVLALGGVSVPMVWGVWGPLLWMALASGLLALLLQTWAQARMSATRAVVIMTFEPVFASLFAILAGQEPMTWRLLVGGGLALTAMQLSELGPVVRAERLARRGGQERAASAPGAG